MTDSVLIVGGGISGLTAAQHIAAAGAHAIVVEQRAIVGGRLAAPMTKASAIGNRAEGQSIPLLEALNENENIEILTNATLQSVDGRAGNFTVSIREKARFVTDACTRCKLCHGVCPVVLPNEFDAGLTFRKAIYTPMLITLPETWVIDIDKCLNTPPNYLPCNRCIDVCDDDAIHFDTALEKRHERQVGAVILAPGMTMTATDGLEELGYGAHPDIVTSAELQRLLESPGPTGGYASRPSDEEYPEHVLLVLDDPSPFGLYIVASQAEQLIEQDVPQVTVLVLSQATGIEAAQQLKDKTGIQVHWGTAVQVDPETENGITVSFEDFAEKKLVEKCFDMIVICIDVEPPPELPELAGVTGIEVAEDGFFKANGTNDAGGQTTQAGIYAAGCATGPKNISDSIAEAGIAADAALAQLNPILLDGETAAAPQQTPNDDDMRGQIEKLLHALINQPG
jgi:heterodisulfide reductase subunit A